MRNSSSINRRAIMRASAALGAGLLIGPTLAQASRGAPLKLGMVVPVTGRFASYGGSAVPGARLATRLINEKGGVAALGNAPLELVLADSKGEAKVTVAEIERLINDQKVAGIIGPFSSLDALAANPLSDQYKVPFVSPFWSSEKAFTLNSRYSRTLNLTSGSYAAAAVNLLKVLRNKHGVAASKVAVVYDNSEYGRAAADAVKRLLVQGGTPAALDLPVTPGSSDYGPTILRVRDSGADVVLAGFYFQETVLLLRAADALNFRVPIIGFGSGFADARLPGALGPEVAARALKAPVFGTTTGMRESTKYGPLQALLKAAEKEPVRPGITPGVELEWYGLGAQAVYVFKVAFEQAATTAGPKVNDAILAMNMPRGADSLVVPFYDPSLSWERNGQPRNQAPSVAQWQDGKSVIVFPEDAAAAAPRL
ncbi:ABC transporter substrate-binding protein [Ramlibacter sp. RBP-2]|uniref:ABC transporter substrate-binding protein n=1 Tax=Ramlibacter lithotrophicus TaxID=2606681 RepID=A0A7X6I8Z8_9BURK|nr:ABC transporter substrate-binding protein [Ramlibacter lithotrophicus]NKE68890.1 ABC transporter substrate-binding protein [Ramlibacter lithotrophicus]